MKHLEQSSSLARSDAVSSTSVLLEDAGQFFSVAAACGIGLWSFDLLTRRWALSDEIRTILGLAAGHGSDVSMLGERLLETGNPEIIIRVSRADTGQDSWLLSSTQTVLDAQGQAIRIVGMLRDVTTLRRSEIEQDKADNCLDAALTVGRMVIWDLDIATGIVTRSAKR